MEVVYLAQLKDLVSVEKQLLAALPKIAEEANDERFKAQLVEHAKQTQTHHERVTELLEEMGAKPGRKKCKGMAGIIEEGEELFGSTGEPSAIDAALIASAQRAEHYEMAGYGTAAAMAGVYWNLA
jgi:ferritin-like metal-binding protein YciE